MASPPLGQSTDKAFSLSLFSGSHVVVDGDRVKLCNLTTAVLLSDDLRDEDLLEDIVMTLPPHVLAPEVGLFLQDLHN